MKSVNSEIKKVISKVKDAQSQLQSLIKSQDWVDEARKYAKRQGKEVRKLFGPDVDKMKSFLERERKELERFQKQIPSEVKKFRKFVDLQRKEFEKLLSNVRKMSLAPAEAPRKPARAKKSGSARPKKRTRPAAETASQVAKEETKATA